MPDAPQFPAGPFDSASVDARQRADHIATISAAPAELSQSVEGLASDQLDAVYRNWSVRQIVHHLADSHLHSYVRFKWTLTEDEPLIKAYDESDWSQLPDARTADIDSSLQLLTGLHARWTQALRHMTDADFARAFKHPETGDTVPLSEAVAYYAWHGRHHTAQIRWVRQNRL